MPILTHENRPMWKLIKSMDSIYGWTHKNDCLYCMESADLNWWEWMDEFGLKSYPINCIDGMWGWNCVYECLDCMDSW